MQDTAPPVIDETPLGRHRAGGRGSWTFRIGVLLVLLLVAGAVAAVRYYDWCQGASGPREPVTFEVAEGAGGSEIVDDLHREGVVRCGMVSKWLLRRSGLEAEFRSGTFELTTNMTPDEAFTALTRPLPERPTARLTIPEGYRLTQIADRVEEVLGIPSGGSCAPSRPGTGPCRRTCRRTPRASRDSCSPRRTRSSRTPPRTRSSTGSSGSSRPRLRTCRGTTRSGWGSTPTRSSSSPR